MAKATGIETNMTDISGARTSTSASSVGKFDSVFDAASYTAALAGPVTAASLAQQGNYRGADIVSAAVNATAGYSAPGMYSGGAASYGGGSRALGVSGNVSYGGGSAAAMLNPGATSDPMTMAQNQLAESQASNISMLMIQDEMGTQNRFFTTTSNLMSSRDNMLSSIIRNVRVG